MSSDEKKTQLGAPPVTTGAPTWADVAPSQAPAGLPATPPGSAASSFVHPPDPLIGHVMAGRYLVQKKLGEGGMGAVYLAQHTVLEKSVALKVLHGEFARKPDLVERFMQEAKAASRIRHENVIDISDFGTAGENLVFFAMELLNGHDLHEEIARARLSKTRLPWERSRKIFLQICAALSAAHAQGIVHRDLKPENIYLVEWLGHKDFVKLLDFGIAKLTEVSEGDRKLTRTGMLFGTPEYMSPEQARGENVDHRVDIYAMGCILYQLCCGRVPFEAENFMGILSLHLTEPPPPLGAPLLTGIGAPPELEGIIMKALAKSRHERWQTVDEMANAIRALHGEAAQPVAEVRVPRVESRPPAGSFGMGGGGGGAAGAGAATGARSRTEWKGNLQVPVMDDVPVPPRAKPVWPWLVAGALVVGGGVAVALVATGGKKASETAAPALVVDAAVGAGSASSEVPPLPAQVTIKLDSVPQGADVTDAITKQVVGKTPFELVLPGSREPRRFTFTLAKHGGKMIELVPDEDVTYTAQLVKVAAGKAAPAVVAEVVPQKARPGREATGGGGPVTTPDGPGSGSGSDAGSVAGTASGSGSSKPGGKKPAEKPGDKPGSGSASGSQTGSSSGSGEGSASGSSGGSSDDVLIKIKDPFAGQGGGGGGGGDGSASGSSAP